MCCYLSSTTPACVYWVYRWSLQDEDISLTNFPFLNRPCYRPYVECCTGWCWCDPHPYICYNYKPGYNNAWLFKWPCCWPHIYSWVCFAVGQVWWWCCNTHPYLHAGMLQHPVGDHTLFELYMFGHLSVRACMQEYPVGLHTCIVWVDYGRPREMLSVPLPYLRSCLYALNRLL